MAIYQFSALSDGQAISFNPASDTLNFDQPAIAAADLRVVTEGSNIRINVVDGTASGKDVVLLNTADLQLATSNITFAGGSKLLFGDNSAAQTADNSANSLTGTAGHDLLEGFGGSDTLTGGAGNDVLIGGTQFDRLVGGTGNDTFLFNVAATGANADLIVDFASGADKIALDTSIYSNAGALGNFAAGDARFYAAAGATSGHDANDRVIYNTTNGTLWYDPDGSGSAASQLIGTLQGAPALTASDIAVASSSAPAGGGGGSTINGTAGNDNITGTPGDDAINGLGGDDVLFGDPIDSAQQGNDTISGGDGNDDLFGRGGDDVMNGDAGDDAFVIDSNSPDFSDAFPGNDSIDGGTGTDWIEFSTESVSSTGPIVLDLGAGTYSIDDSRGQVLHGTVLNVENAQGSAFTDIIRGSSAANILDGFFGDDTILGLGGDDRLIGSFGNDHLEGGDGNDTLLGDDPGTFAAGNDYLDGGAGVDTMNGGDGDDIYVVTAGDVIESDTGGTDTVLSSVSWSLGANSNLENLTLTGTGAITASGNQLDNVLRGNGADNSSINGRAGNDTMFGMGGNDTFDMSTGGTSSYGNDVIDGGTGTDTIDFGSNAQSGVAVNLASGAMSGGGASGAGSATVSNVENVVGGNFNDVLTGNAAANFFFGGLGNDRLAGGAGSDRLQGGGGNDTFIFANAGGANADQILDFTSGRDKLAMDNGFFTAIGADGNFAAGDARFFAGAGATSGHDASDRIVYNSTTGNLYYDADGSGAGAAQLVATIQGHPAVTATDIAVI